MNRLESNKICYVSKFLISPQFTTWIKLESKQSEEFWIGLTDSREEGVYQWRSGRPLSMELGKHWKYGEPDNYKNRQHCIQMYNLEINDKECRNYRDFVCERRNITSGGGWVCTYDQIGS